MNIPIRRHDDEERHPADAALATEPEAAGGDAQGRLLAAVDQWLTALADELDAHVAVLTEAEGAFPAARRLASSSGEDELSVRRGERAFLDGVLHLASLGSTLRRGTAPEFGPRVGVPGTPAVLGPNSACPRCAGPVYRPEHPDSRGRHMLFARPMRGRWTFGSGS